MQSARLCALAVISFICRDDDKSLVIVTPSSLFPFPCLISLNLIHLMSKSLTLYRCQQIKLAQPACVRTIGLIMIHYNIYSSGNNQTSIVVCSFVLSVLANTAEDKLLHRLLETNEHRLLSIPAAHHIGQNLVVEIRLALKQIIRMV